MPVFSGRLLLDDAVVEGWLEVEAGRTVDWGEGKPPSKPHATGWIVPSPVNAHTHVADACLRDRPGKPASVAELVGPGGWKQRNLAAASADEVVTGVHRYVDEMAAVGTSRFIDFREGGVEGVRLLRALTADLAVEPIVLARPKTNRFDDAEVRDLVAAADGLGLSAARDFPARRDIEALADLCHKTRKPFALHASEARREPMEDILALEPTFLVHCTQATKRDFEAIADAEVTVVVCPRSNAHYGMKSPVAAMVDAGVKVAVGTDNGMLQDGNILAELALLKSWSALDDETLLRMATVNSRRLAGIGEKFPPRKGAPCDAIVIPDSALRPTSTKPGLIPLSSPSAGPTRDPNHS